MVSQNAASVPITINFGVTDDAEPEPVEDSADVGVVVVPLEAVLLREADAALFLGGRRGHGVQFGMSRVEEWNVVEFLGFLWHRFLLTWNVVVWRPCAAVWKCEQEYV